jgi:hypothetical protein
LFKPNLINMTVHSATCSCSVELYKLWYTLADFLPNWDISRGFLYISLISSQCCLEGCIVAQESTTLPRIFSKTGIYLYNINFAERNSEAAMGRGGGNIFRVHGSSIRVQRSSEGCSIALRVQCIGCSVAQ